jgi:hypothetical protein
MNPRQRNGRTLFLMFICSSYVAVIASVPLLNALSRGSAQSSMSASAGASMAAPSARTFEQIDRDKDGFIDSIEAQALGGLTAVLDGADANQDGKLDKVEFARALGFMDDQK